MPFRTNSLIPYLRRYLLSKYFSSLNHGVPAWEGVHYNHLVYILRAGNAEPTCMKTSLALLNTVLVRNTVNTPHDWSSTLYIYVMWPTIELKTK
jgi:hypothetical protein